MPNAGTIYAIGIEDSTLVKIGWTQGPVEKRLRALQTGNPLPLYVIATLPVDEDAQPIEQLIHQFLADERRRGEWFDVALDAERLAALIARAITYLHTHASPRKMKYPIGPRVRTMRRAKDLTQQQLAEMAGLNMMTISRIEHGTATQIYADTLGDLARALGVSADYLLGLQEDTPHA